MRSILITGVQGAGKSTVGCSAAQTLGMQTLDYADLMLRVVPDLQTKDEIRHLSWAERNRIYEKVNVLLADYFVPGDGRSECVLLENHLSILDAEGLRTFPHDDIRRYNAIGLVLEEMEGRSRETDPANP